MYLGFCIALFYCLIDFFIKVLEKKQPKQRRLDGSLIGIDGEEENDEVIMLLELEDNMEELQVSMLVLKRAFPNEEMAELISCLPVPVKVVIDGGKVLEILNI